MTHITINVAYLSRGSSLLFAGESKYLGKEIDQNYFDVTLEGDQRKPQETNKL